MPAASAARAVARALLAVSAIFAAPVGAQTIISDSHPLDFGYQSAQTGKSREVSAQAAGLTTTMPFTVVSSSRHFVVTQGNCTNVVAGTPCKFTIAFKPLIAAGPLNSDFAVAGTLAFTTQNGTTLAVPVHGVAERSLVEHFYAKILRRAPDAAGKAFWRGESVRIAGLGADLREVWFAMSRAFVASPEAGGGAALPDAQFIDWLYQIYFDRPMDTEGLAYWRAQMEQGLTREAIVLSFMFSPEFAGLNDRVFGPGSARPEVNLVNDFYRGILGRLPDDAGFAHWVARFRSAQCRGAAAVRAEVDALSGQFVQSGEYAARGRNPAQAVADLYDAFLRRGPDAGGLAFWVGQLQAGTFTPEALRRTFLDSPEFAARVNAAIAAGCA